jgi:hypothetical protein
LAIAGSHSRAASISGPNGRGTDSGSHEPRSTSGEPAADEVGDQRGLAGSGLAGDQHELAAARSGPGQRCVKIGQLPIALDQG